MDFGREEHSQLEIYGAMGSSDNQRALDSHDPGSDDDI